MTQIRYACSSDREFWFSMDKHLPECEFEKKIRYRQCYILTDCGNAVGILRYNFFWDNTPFCNLLYIAAGHRGMGYGKTLMKYWEAEMRANGYGIVMTSSRADETAQHFFRKLGYNDCGALMINEHGYEQPAEIFFLKSII